MISNEKIDNPYGWTLSDSDYDSSGDDLSELYYDDYITPTTTENPMYNYGPFSPPMNQPLPVVPINQIPVNQAPPTVAPEELDGFYELKDFL